MQIGLMAKLIGRPVEVRALPVTLRYSPTALRWETGKGAAGAAAAAVLIVALDPAIWVAAPIGLVGVLFGLYAVQQWRRGFVHYEVDERTATRVAGTTREAIPWETLEDFRLHFYAFGRKAREGTLEVRLRAAGHKFKIDSAVDHFPTLLVHAARVSRARGLHWHPTTQANLDQLGL